MSLFTKIKVMLSGLLIVTPVFVGTVAAQGTTTTPPATTPPTQTTADEEESTTTDTTAEESALTPAQKAQRLQERITKRKTELKTRVAAAEQQRLVAKCNGAQTVITNMVKHTATMETKRGKVHDGITGKLNDLVTKLEAQGVDTTELKAAIAGLETKIEAQQASLDGYKTALDDLTKMDCAKDPTGFKASLEDARRLRADLAAQSSELRTYIANEIKPVLQDLRKQLGEAGAE